MWSKYIFLATLISMVYICFILVQKSKMPWSCCSKSAACEGKNKPIHETGILLCDSFVMAAAILSVLWNSHAPLISHPQRKNANLERNWQSALCCRGRQWRQRNNGRETFRKFLTVLLTGVKMAPWETMEKQHAVHKAWWLYPHFWERVCNSKN